MNLIFLAAACFALFCFGDVAQSFEIVEKSGDILAKTVRRELRSISKRSSLDSLLDQFGTNNLINRTELSNLMGLLGLRTNNTSPGRISEKCMTASNVFSANGLQKEKHLNKTTFQAACPTLLEQMLKTTCKQSSSKKPISDGEKKLDNAKAWGIGFLSVTIISLASMLGAFIVPFMNKEFYKKILLFMVSLAVGVLGGSGVFHLIPHTFGLGIYNNDYIWKCTVIVGGIYFFFITENIMKMYIRFADWKRRKISGQENLDESQEIFHPTMMEPSLCHPVAVIDGVHGNHALDSVHVSCKKYEDEHGVDSLNMAGNHYIDKKDTSEYFKDTNSVQSKSIFARVAPVAWMIILGDGLHNFIDGLAIGVSFTNNIVEGISTSLAIFCEELPHELGDFAILLNSGLSYKQAILANFLSACTCYIGLIIGTILGSTTHIVKWIYALAGGMFLYISLVDMLPEATGMQVTISGNSRKETLKNFLIVNFAMILGYALMLLLAMYSQYIQI